MENKINTVSTEYSNFENSEEWKSMTSDVLGKKKTEVFMANREKGKKSTKSRENASERIVILKKKLQENLTTMKEQRRKEGFLLFSVFSDPR